MRRLVELPLWAIGLTVIGAGAIGGGACAAIDLAIRSLRRQP
ncbi:hypothetical protein [Streptomyces sp. 1222.5]